MNFKLLNNPFNLVDNKRDRFILILIVLIFSIFFINLFKPWNIGRWYSDSGFIKFLRLSSYGIVVALVLLFTQFPLRMILKQQEFKIKTYILWFLIEILLISLVYILMYGNPIGNFVNDFLFSLKYTVLGICIPYSFALLIIYYKNQKAEIKQLQTKIAQTPAKKLIAFKDDNGKIKFSVLAKDLLVLESTDNYVSVFYILDGKLQRELLRNTMKKMEESFKDSSVIRCHRSFMVNSENVEFVKKSGKKLYLKVHLMDKTVPVSEKYSSLFLALLS
ncbi:LytTR family DNA-binding domain-containing protein [Prolixibacteraceae bacterium Z1-6]|uniref:LytTR family DNA-binding domain-containing protein n=1 Tax=Draconibacterium aestuarii TaxID=2998507 RepID=A0A9X3J764_9BACT|nr:LytTR family DNA-binding domain-containing protein [Prolixibacteraceae bacterium Z1-6]